MTIKKIERTFKCGVTRLSFGILRVKRIQNKGLQVEVWLFVREASPSQLKSMCPSIYFIKFSKFPRKTTFGILFNTLYIFPYYIPLNWKSILCYIAKCESYQWKCASGQCIDQIQRCNGKFDCTDRSDEIGCKHCTMDQFRCDNGSCLKLSVRCNGVADCEHGEDEEHCGWLKQILKTFEPGFWQTD